MSITDLVIQSQLFPPRPRKSLLRRPRVDARLNVVFDYPLTIVQAGTGYGKTTALASLTNSKAKLFWYTITEPDHDPLLFLVHLFSAFDIYGEKALKSLETNNGVISAVALNPLLNALTSRLKTDTVLVLDDFHIVLPVDEIAALVRKLIEYCPPKLHIVLSTRHMPDFPEINKWRVKDMLETITSSDLAFSVEEIESLFREQYHYPITHTQAQSLAKETEGWAIALQMVWQGLQSGIVPNLDTPLQLLPDVLNRLFDYLAPEVLSRQPAYMQRFLLTTSILRQMDGPACDFLLETHDSLSTLRHLYDIGLFVDMTSDDTYRYQRLFHDFLLSQASRDKQRTTTLHRSAAEYYERINLPEETLHHLLEAEEFQRAADLIEKIGSGLLASGRLDSLNDWLTRLPEEYRRNRPTLELLYGDICRLQADFEEAVAHFNNSARLYKQRKDPLGQSRALRGQAQVFLDTVRPLEAAALLANALDLLEPNAYPMEVADLLEQLAENKLNFGFPDQAQDLHRQSLKLRGETKPSDIYLNARILLRTGRLAEAQRLLESSELDEPVFGLVRQQHFHREKQLLLSLLCVLQGNQQAAERYARQGIIIGQRIQSDFVEAVGLMRLGHALQLNSFRPWGKAKREQAIQCYYDVIERVKPFKVPRVSLEPLWGLVRAHGYEGNIEAAETNAARVIEIARTAGDEWFGHFARISVGATLVMAGQHKAAERWLKEAAEGLDRVQDTFGWSAAQLWLALNAWWKDDVEVAMRHLSALLPVVYENGYEYLIIKRTHLGIKDDQVAIPMLIEAHRQNIEREFTLKLLTQAGKRGLEYHPGYTLWVRTLGPFQVWRGDDPISNKDWQREKARQLFQLLITTRGQWLQREQIVDMLWPDLSTDSAEQNFKVALNALNRALEPERLRQNAPYFVIRQGNTYGINPQAQIITDAEQFLFLSQSNEEDSLRYALSLYEDDFLPDCRYADWADADRDRYRQKYFSVVEHLSYVSLQNQQPSEAITICQTALQRDKSWETGYAMLMRAYAAQGNITQVQHTYHKCVTILQEELGIEPSVETQELRQTLTKGG